MSNSSNRTPFAPPPGGQGPRGRGILYQDGDDMSVSSVYTVEDLAAFQAKLQERSTQAAPGMDDNDGDLRQFNALTCTTNNDQQSMSAISSRIDTTSDIGAVDDIDILSEYTFGDYSYPVDEENATGTHVRAVGDAAVKSAAAKASTGAADVVHATPDTNRQPASYIVDHTSSTTARGQESQQPNKNSIFSPRKPWLQRNRRFLMALIVIVVGLAFAIGISVSTIKNKNTEKAAATSSATDLEENNSSSFNDKPKAPPADNSEDEEEPEQPSEDPNEEVFKITSAPSAAPSAAPTVAPSATPSAEPTANPTTTPLPASLFQVLVEEDLLTMQTAVVEANLFETLNKQDTVQTLFAPIDDAFVGSLPSHLESKIFSRLEWRLHLKHLLLHHIVADDGKNEEMMIMVDQLVDGQVFIMKSGELVEVTRAANSAISINNNNNLGDSNDYEDIRLNDNVSITVADVNADNGVAHVINGLLRPLFLSTTVLDVIAEHTESTTEVFASLLELAGLTNKLKTLDEEFTIFAPTNKAFATMDPDTLSFLQSEEGRPSLIQTLRQHLAWSIVPTTSINRGQTTVVTSLEGTQLSLKKDGSSSAMLVNGVAIADSNVLASNGIVHTIETVLLHPNVTLTMDALTSVPTQAPVTAAPIQAPSNAPSQQLCDFVCPSNSTTIVNELECYSSFADCLCDEGFVKQGEECALTPTGPVCDYTCPANASLQSGLSCATGFQDCDCTEGFTKYANQCSRCTYQCPVRASRIANRTCYASFDDCQCDVGYTARNGRCVLLLSRNP